MQKPSGERQGRHFCVATLVSWVPGEVFIAAMDRGGVCKILPSRIKKQPQMLGNSLRPEPGQAPGRKWVSMEGPWDLMVLEDTGEKNIRV